MPTTKDPLPGHPRRRVLLMLRGLEVIRRDCLAVWRVERKGEIVPAALPENRIAAWVDLSEQMKELGALVAAIGTFAESQRARIVNDQTVARAEKRAAAARRSRPREARHMNGH